jgi:predicted amidophosphoribosyltransferase
MANNKKFLCPECKTENPYYAKFCQECGTNLEFIEDNGSNEIDTEQDHENICHGSNIWNYEKHEKAIILGWLPFS